MIFWITCVSLVVVGVVLCLILYPKFRAIWLHSKYTVAHNSLRIRKVTKQLGEDPTYQVGYLRELTGVFDLLYEAQDELDANREYYYRKSRLLQLAQSYKGVEVEEPMSEEEFIVRMKEDQEPPPEWIRELMEAKTSDEYRDDTDVEVTEISLDLYYENCENFNEYLQFVIGFLETAVESSYLEPTTRDSTMEYLSSARATLEEGLEESEGEEISGVSKSTLLEAGYPAEMIAEDDDDDDDDDDECPVSPADLVAFILEERPKTQQEILEDAKPMNANIVMLGLDLLTTQELVKQNSEDYYYLVGYEYEDSTDD